MRKTFFIKTFGCKVNQFESEYFISSLLQNGFVMTGEDEADLIIINSCAVTKEAERQFFQYVRKIKRNYPLKKIIATGCSVENNFKKLQSEKLIAATVSNFYKKEIPNVVNSLLLSKKNISLYKPIDEEIIFNDLTHNKAPFHTRKFFKIQDGCDNFCSYCIIPFLRGIPRSMDMKNIVKHILTLKNQFKEIVLTGINIGIYGKDLGYKNGLLHLLETIEDKLIQKNVVNFRIRLSSLKPDEISNELIDFAQKSRFLAPHFHLSIQNFNDKILKLMNRKYNYSLIKERVDKIRNSLPFSGIGADVITGFPEENSSEFEDNVVKMENININFFHIFPFSKRENTEAFLFNETSSKKEKKERVNILKDIADKKKELFIKNNLNKKLKVLIESAESQYFSGYSGNYIKVVVPYVKNLQLKNQFINVKGETIKNKFYIQGRIL